jgi:hypothetical protein
MLAFAHEFKFIRAGPGETHPDRLPIFSTPVEKYFDLRLTGPVKHGALFKVSCFVQNPSAEMRGGFLFWWLPTQTPLFPDAQLRIGECRTMIRPDPAESRGSGVSPARIWKRNGCRIAPLPPLLRWGGRFERSSNLGGGGAFAPAVWQLIPLCRASRRNFRARCLLVDGSRFIIGVVPPPPPFELRSNVPHDRASLDRTTARAGGRGEEKRHASNAIAPPQAGRGEPAQTCAKNF